MKLSYYSFKKTFFMSREIIFCKANCKDLKKSLIKIKRNSLKNVKFIFYLFIYSV